LIKDPNKLIKELKEKEEKI